MSPRHESALKTILVGVAITLGGSIVIAAYHAKEDVSQHSADVAAIDAKLQRILDVMCDVKPEKRACK